MTTETVMGSVPTAGEAAPNDRLAAIDIGSNSIRLVVAQPAPGGHFRVLDEERASTRLARSLDSTRRLDSESVQASLAALRRFKKLAEGQQATHLRTIATCAVREAENGEEFCQVVREETGLEVEVISAEQEAKYAFLSVQRAYEVADRNIAVADIGGGSTELVLASGNHIEAICSTPLGAVRLTEMYGTSARLFGDDYDYMLQHIDRTLKKKLKSPPFVPQVLFGTGGTFTSMASVLMASKGQPSTMLWGYRTTRAQVRHILDRLRSFSPKQRRNVPGLSADRADIIIAGLAVIDRIMKHLKVNILQVHTGGVRDGLLYTMLDRLCPTVGDTEHQQEAIKRFASSCGADWAHSQHVAFLAEQIFTQLAEPLELCPQDQAILQAAAMLQDVGYLINYQQHHKHSYQLILNSQLPGYRRHELELIANVARYHRGAKPKRKHANFRHLSADEQQRVRQMVAILRLAVALDRSHNQTVRSVQLDVDGYKIRMAVQADGDPEVDLWAARRRVAMFEKVFNKEVWIHAQSQDGTGAH